MLAPEGVSISLYHGLGDLPHFNPDLEPSGQRRRILEGLGTVSLLPDWLTVALEYGGSCDLDALGPVDGQSVADTTCGVWVCGRARYWAGRLVWQSGVSL